MRSILACSFFVVGLALLPTRAISAVEAKPDVPMVFVSKLKTNELFDLLSYPARVVSKVNTTLLAESDGVVSKISMGLGQKVLPKTRIMTITHTDPVYQYAPASITSPVAGIVSQVHVTEGTHVTRGQRLVSVTDPEQLQVSVEIPASDLGMLTPGMKGELRITGTDQSVAVAVHGISPFVDPATGTASCEIQIMSSGQAHVSPGMVGQVSFKANLHQGIVIPEHAIIYKGNEPFVRLAQDGKVKQVAVKLGKKQRGQVEVLSGLSEGLPLIERSSRFVTEGDSVTVTQ